MTFDEHVRAALDSLPPELAGALENVAIVVEPENTEEPDLFGLYEVPLPSAAGDLHAGEDLDLPQAARGGLPDPAELEEQIRVTVLHELAHYFGFEEDRIADLGYE